PRPPPRPARRGARAARLASATRRSAAARSGCPRAAAVGRMTIRIDVAPGSRRCPPTSSSSAAGSPTAAATAARASARRRHATAAASSRASRNRSSPARYSPPPCRPIGPVMCPPGRVPAVVAAAGRRSSDGLSRASRDDTRLPFEVRRAYDPERMPSRFRDVVARIAAWTRRWDAILPLLAAELIVWLGFGALLPIMPIYFTENGVDLRTLGVVVAAWPAARLVGEPVFGWVADRTRRVPLMVAGNIGAGLFLFLPLVLVGAAPFIVLRALAGLATSIYDPAARGYIADATPADRRGEAFGMYGAAQMGGLLLGPAIGGLGSA